ncbi:MAG: DUF4404 family protein [Kangiellaceae bacterium]|nr:DUF4404 family protein [Kangiellaceae bacterium]
MNRQQMVQILSELDQQLDEDHDIDEYHRDKTTALTQFIRNMLSEEEDHLPADEFLTKKLQQTIDQFEIRHPQLTSIIGRISDLLAKSGV